MKNDYLDKLTEIEQEYNTHLAEVEEDFLQVTAKLKNPRDKARYLEAQKDRERHINDLALTRHNKIEALKANLQL